MRGRYRAVRTAWLVLGAVSLWVAIILTLCALVARQVPELAGVLASFALMISSISFLIAYWIYD